eukprot:gene11803-13285_t
MAEKTSTFDGNDLNQWLRYFRLQYCGLEAIFQEMEVEDVRDLPLVFEDEKLLDATRVNHRIGVAGTMKLKSALRSTSSLSLYTSPDIPRKQPVGKKASTSSNVETTHTHGDIDMQGTRCSTYLLETNENRTQTVSYEETQGSTPKKSREVMAIEKKLEIEKLELDIKQVCDMDFAFLVDCTGGMQSFILAIQYCVVLFAGLIRQLHPLLKLRIAFVGYRDFGDEDQLVVHPFTEDASSISDFLQSQRAMGGGDEAEDVLGGLEGVKNVLDWLAKIRILYHIGDAPGHGVELHDSKVTDNRSNEFGEAHYRPVLRSLDDKEIKYFFGKIKPRTDMMIAFFNQLVGFRNYILETPVGEPNELMNVVYETVVNSISQSLSRTWRVLAPRELEDFLSAKLDLNEPDWHGLEVEDITTYNMIVPCCQDNMSIKEVVSGNNDRCVEDKPIISRFCKVANRPFAVGGLHLTYYGKIVIMSEEEGEDCNKVERDVVLRFLPKNDKRLPCEQFLSCYSTASFMAKEFNKMLDEVNPDRDWPRIQYVEANIIQLMTRWPNPPYVICEDRLPSGTALFEKYNSNTGYCAPNPTLRQNTHHEIIQAFSHWSYEVSDEHLMVVSCQGAFVNNTFLLTDPAIHCLNVLQYGESNLGEKGFEYFFRSHRCSKYCGFIGLPNH